MYLWFGLAVLVAGAIGTLLFTPAGTYAKTVWLIVQTSPYEQTGSGAGTILVVGDSTGYGTGAPIPAASVAGRLGQEYPEYQILNNSQNGRQVDGARAAVADLNRSYDLILLQIGANDILAERPAAAVAADVQAVAEAARSHANAVVIMSAGNVGGSPRFQGASAKRLRTISQEYDALMQAYAQETERIWFVSLYDAPADDPFVAEPSVYMAWDGLHPTAAGYQVWFEKAQPSFAAALAR